MGRGHPHRLFSAVDPEVLPAYLLAGGLNVNMWNFPRRVTAFGGLLYRITKTLAA